LPAGFFLAVCLLLVPGASAQRTQLKPGWNKFFTARRHIPRQAGSHRCWKTIGACNAPKVDAYLTQLGTRLVQKLPTGGVQYPFEFHCVNDKAINAFCSAWRIRVHKPRRHRAADNEAQLAGVMAHELSQCRSPSWHEPSNQGDAGPDRTGIFGAVFGDTTGGALLTELGSFTAGGVLLRYSRTAESQADVMGSSPLRCGVRSAGHGAVFRKARGGDERKNPPEFFSDHPNPEHRVERVDEEVEKLGGAPPAPSGLR